MNVVDPVESFVYMEIVTVKEIFPEKNRVLYETKIVDVATGADTLVGEAFTRI